jgi:hypothetical protein
MSERDAFLAGWRHAAEAMVQAHDPLVTLIAETVARLLFDEVGDEEGLAVKIDTGTLDAMAEVKHVRLDPAAAELAYRVWRLGRAAPAV